MWSEAPGEVRAESTFAAESDGDGRGGLARNRPSHARHCAGCRALPCRHSRNLLLRTCR